MTKAVTDTTGEKATNRPRQRPRDRKNRILAAAAQRFWTLGYHQVSMADIAADVDITASALYRHFRGKQDLLLAVLDEQLRAIEEVDPARADDFAAEFIDVCLRQREFGVLWERESGHLPDDERDRLRHRIRVLAERAGADIEDRSTADVRSWAILSVLESQSYYHGPLDLAHVKDVLTRAVSAISTTPLPPDERVLVERAGGIRPASRREHLLAVAVKLFAERGYPSVGLDDIGAAAGIAGPSVYNHFTTKVDVLSAALNRGNETLWLGLHQVLSAASTPAEALDGLARHYTEFTVANSDIVTILIAQTINLPEDRMAVFRRAQRDYLTEWVTLLRGARPEVSEDDAAVLVRAAITLINSLARIPHLRTKPGHVGNTTRLAQAVLRA